MAEPDYVRFSCALVAVNEFMDSHDIKFMNHVGNYFGAQVLVATQKDNTVIFVVVNNEPAHNMCRELKKVSMLMEVIVPEV